MPTATEEALRDAGLGLSAEELDRLIAQAVRRMALGRLTRSEPSRDFSPTERAVLTAGGLDLSALRSGEERSVVLAAAEYEALLASSLTVREAAQRLGVDGSRIRQRLAARQLYGIRRPDGWRLPSFQFEDDHAVPGIERVLPRLNPRLHPIAVVGWFGRPYADLHRPDDPEEAPMTPLEWLRSGGPVDVVADLAEDATGYA